MFWRRRSKDRHNDDPFWRLGPVTYGVALGAGALVVLAAGHLRQVPPAWGAAAVLAHYYFLTVFTLVSGRRRRDFWLVHLVTLLPAIALLGTAAPDAGPNARVTAVIIGLGAGLTAYLPARRRIQRCPGNDWGRARQCDDRYR